VTDRLIPLYAIGAFLAFTLSQAGMVSHWRKAKGPGASRSMLINGLGALATGVTLLVVLVAKFTEGAWVTALLVAVLLVFMLRVRRHYDRVAHEVRSSVALDVTSQSPPIVIVPIQEWGKIAQNGLRFALTLSPDIHAVHVATEEDCSELEEKWSKMVDTPAKKAGINAPKLVTLTSPYRLVITPIVDYVLKTERANPGRNIAVIVPELVERHWYHYPLHNQRAQLLKAFILFKGDRRIILMNVPWYLKE
jgi:hypothetical protein